MAVLGIKGLALTSVPRPTFAPAAAPLVPSPGPPSLPSESRTRDEGSVDPGILAPDCADLCARAQASQLQGAGAAPEAASKLATMCIECRGHELAAEVKANISALGAARVAEVKNFSSEFLANRTTELRGFVEGVGAKALNASNTSFYDLLHYRKDLEHAKDYAAMLTAYDAVVNASMKEEAIVGASLNESASELRAKAEKTANEWESIRNQSEGTASMLWQAWTDTDASLRASWDVVRAGREHANLATSSHEQARNSEGFSASSVRLATMASSRAAKKAQDASTAAVQAKADAQRASQAAAQSEDAVLALESHVTQAEGAVTVTANLGSAR